MADLLSVDEARNRILAQFCLLGAEEVPLLDSADRILGAEVRSGMNLPPFANSSMDGFALASHSVLHASSGSPMTLAVTGHIAAGSIDPGQIQEGECSRIMTGAPLPLGANAVIPFEQVEDKGDTILVREDVGPGSCVRPAGNDVPAGEVLLDSGTELGPAQIALLAAVGVSQVTVRRRPVVAVLSTGDELVAPGTELKPGQIYNSNNPMLLAAIREAGGSGLPVGTTGDDPRSISQAVQAVPEADLLLTSGGASVGDFDYVRDVVAASGDLGFWRVRVRPGKPLLFGSIGKLPVIGLPGNPTSAMVTFELFARPAIRKMLGAALYRPRVEAIVDERIDNRGGRRTFARVKLDYVDGQFHASLSGPQDSAMLLPLARADGLLMIPEDREEMGPGDVGMVEVWRLRGEPLRN